MMQVKRSCVAGAVVVLQALASRSDTDFPKNTAGCCLIGSRRRIFHGCARRSRSGRASAFTLAAGTSESASGALKRGPAARLTFSLLEACP